MAEREGKTFDVDDLASAFIRFENGASLILETSWASNSEKREDQLTQLFGVQGGALIRNWDEGYQFEARVFRDQHGDVSTEIPDAPEHGETPQQHFCRAILHDRSRWPPVSRAWWRCGSSMRLREPPAPATRSASSRNTVQIPCHPERGTHKVGLPTLKSRSVAVREARLLPSREPNAVPTPTRRQTTRPACGGSAEASPSHFGIDRMLASQARFCSEPTLPRGFTNAP